MLPRYSTIYIHTENKSGHKILEAIPLPPPPIDNLSGITYHVSDTNNDQRTTNNSISRLLGTLLLTISLGGIMGPLFPTMQLEAKYRLQQMKQVANQQMNKLTNKRSDEVTNNTASLPSSVPVIFNPLVRDDGSSIDPVNTEFSLIIPKVGINASIVAAVDPADPNQYNEILKTNVAHAATSYLPGQGGTVYLFSHSTNYDWFVQDLNAVFYLLKNLEKDDLIVMFYKGKRFTYRMTDKQVVSPTAISYLVPQKNQERLILQTCWPPGSITERLLIFADLVEEGQRI